MDEISFGILSFKGIADKYDVPISWVYEAWDQLCEQEYAEEQSAYYDELERDHDEPYEPDCDSWYDEQYEIEDQ